MDSKNILRNVARHITLEPEEQGEFLSILKPRMLKKKEVLVRPGTPHPYDYYINRGCVRCYYLDGNGFERIIYFGIEDYWVGDLFSFVRRQNARLFIDALEDTELLFYSSDDVENLYKKVPKFERFFRINFQKAAVALETRIMEFQSVTAEERYKIFLQNYSTLQQRISQKQIASYLGITPVFLSGIRRKFTKEHIY